MALPQLACSGPRITGLRIARSVTSMSKTIEIPKRDWAQYFDSLSRRLEDAEISIEVAVQEHSPSDTARDLALRFLAYLPVEGVFEVAGETVATHPHQTYHHLVADPQRIAVEAAGGSPSRIEVDGGDGGCTVITFE